MKHRGHFTHQEQAPAPPPPDYTPGGVVLERASETDALLNWTFTNEPPRWHVQSKIGELEYGSDEDWVGPGGDTTHQWPPVGIEPDQVLLARIRAEDLLGGGLSDWVESNGLQW